MKFSIERSRVEAFSDAVIAIIITVMVLELPYPSSNSIDHLKSFAVGLFVFFDSFFIVGSLWHKHCVLFQKSDDIPSKMVWRNLLFLFTISLFPIFTKWVIADFGNMLPSLAYALLYFVSGKCSMLLYFEQPVENAEIQLKKRNWIRKIIMDMVIISMFVLALFAPFIASVLFVGIPLLNALSNLWVERQMPEQKEDI